MNFWATVKHAWGLCRRTHVAADHPEAGDCCACRKRLCAACEASR